MYCTANSPTHSTLDVLKWGTVKLSEKFYASTQTYSISADEIRKGSFVSVSMIAT